MASKRGKLQLPRGFKDVVLVLVGCDDFQQLAIKMLTLKEISNAETRVFTSAPKGGQKPTEIIRIWDLSGNDGDILSALKGAIRRQDQSHNIILNNVDLSGIFSGQPGPYIHICNTHAEAISVAEEHMRKQVYVH